MAEEKNTQTGDKKRNVTAAQIKTLAKFASLSKVVTRDLNKLTGTSPTFSVYKKDDIASYLANPYRFEKQLRRAVIYIYGASPHFRRLIQYFVGLSDLAYIIQPYKIDPRKANIKTVNNNYRKTLDLVSSMNIKTQFPQILTVCLREDVFYGTFWVTQDSITVQRLPSDYCAISTIEGNVCNVSFDFSYFDARQNLLDFYPEEFRRKYELYRQNTSSRWIELDSPTSFAVKCNTDILDYALPPFAGILRDIFDLEDYRNLKLTKTALENYALLVMNLPTDSDGNWLIDYDKAVSFWQNLDGVMPEEVGTILSPMKIDKIGFERSNTGDTDTITDAEENLFTAAGVSSQLFNNAKASANALLLSIKADQAITYGIVKSIEAVVNRFIQSFSYGKNFKVTFLDISPYNRKEASDAYLKAASYGIPLISAFAAAQGLNQSELDNMSFLEGTVLELPKMFKPLKNSNTTSSDDLESEAPTDEGGRPPKDAEELTDSGEQSSEDKDDW